MSLAATPGGCAPAAKPSRDDVEDRRKRGVRPNMPAYHDTPLLSVGKQVRVQLSPGRWRRALVECVDEGDGTVDVAFVAGGPGSADEDKNDEEATVSVAAVRLRFVVILASMR
ncbi:unnamed protein product [Polarella glacialis]|uniref:Uncharacterized protein n=1 Tax=Polarella glacialis TaxID=89957 RepID=A0A813GLL4_POLGL|nr:unnamed protein product [Polarella glacialis]